MNWSKFKDKRPTVGMEIEVRWLDDEPSLFTLPTHEFASRDCGVVNRITDEGGKWLYLDCTMAVGAAVRLDYEWREHATPNPI